MFVVKFAVDAFGGGVYKNVWLKISKNFQRSFSQRECEHKSYDLRCYCLLKGYERSEVEQTGDTLNKI